MKFLRGEIQMNGEFVSNLIANGEDLMIRSMSPRHTRKKLMELNDLVSAISPSSAPTVGVVGRNYYLNVPAPDVFKHLRIMNGIEIPTKEGYTVVMFGVTNWKDVKDFIKFSEESCISYLRMMYEFLEDRDLDIDGNRCLVDFGRNRNKDDHTVNEIDFTMRLVDEGHFENFKEASQVISEFMDKYPPRFHSIVDVFGIRGFESSYIHMNLEEDADGADKLRVIAPHALTDVKGYIDMIKQVKNYNYNTYYASGTWLL